MHTYVYVSGGKKCSLFGKFVVFCFLETPVLRFAILPYHQRTIGYCGYRITLSLLHFCPFPANIYLFKVNNRNIRKKCEIYSKLTHVQNTRILNSLYLHRDFYFFDNFCICQTLKHIVIHDLRCINLYPAIAIEKKKSTYWSMRNIFLDSHNETVSKLLLKFQNIRASQVKRMHVETDIGLLQHPRWSAFTKHSMLDVAEVPDPPLRIYYRHFVLFPFFYFYLFIYFALQYVK